MLKAIFHTSLMHIPPLPAQKDDAIRLTALLQEKISLISPEHASWIAGFTHSDEGTALLASVFGNSTYLSHILLKEGAFFTHMMQAGFDVSFHELLEAMRHLPPFTRMEDLMVSLRAFKQKAALLIALADISAVWELEKVTGALSEFAEVAVKAAVNFLLGTAIRLKEITVTDPANPAKNSGLIVLAMGKLGSRELNYSSDIDLIIFYDPHKAQYTGRQTIQHFFIRLARELVQIMQERNGDGYVFRTDLRLRPDPGSTPLAVSIATAKNYYQTVGQNWERAAMIKARVIAGDMEAGERFVRHVIRPFIWRRHLDFAAIEDIRSIKRQIESKNNNVATDLSGYNIKIGHGGIREIEFFVQTQQLIWGGREPSLQIAPTCEILAALVETRHVKKETADELAAIYRYYRMLEHRLQMVADHQTHSLPQGESALEAIAIFIGADSTEAFLEDLRGKIATVKKHYSALFPSSSSLGADGRNLVFTGFENDPETVKALIDMGFTDGDMVSSRIRGWHHGRYTATQSKRVRELLTELIPQILKSMANTASPDMAFLKFDEFLSRLPANTPLFSLLSTNPHLLTLVAELMGSYPYLAENLSRKPALLDYVLSVDFMEEFPTRAVLENELSLHMSYNEGEEDILDSARRWTHERQFQVGVQLIRGLIRPLQARIYLSDIAETALSLCLRRIQEEFSKKHGIIEGGTLAIVAMGKLGGRNLSFRSDIDLILVYDAPGGVTISNGNEPLEIAQYYNRLSRQFITMITALTAEGKLYEVDMRLRPSGNDGPLCTSFKTLDVYFDSTAESWEYMALTRGRVIMADEAFGQRITTLIQEKLIRPRDKALLAAAIIDLRRRIDQKYGTVDKWKVKYVRGGLIDTEFIAQFLQLCYAASHPTILGTDTAGIFIRCGEKGILHKDIAEALSRAALFLFDIQSILRLAYEGRLTSGVKEVLAITLKHESFEAVEQHLTQVEEEGRRYFEKIIV